MRKLKYNNTNIIPVIRSRNLINTKLFLIISIEHGLNDTMHEAFNIQTTGRDSHPLFNKIIMYPRKNDSIIIYNLFIERYSALDYITATSSFNILGHGDINILKYGTISSDCIFYVVRIIDQSPNTVGIKSAVNRVIDRILTHKLLTDGMKYIPKSSVITLPINAAEVMAVYFKLEVNNFRNSLLRKAERRRYHHIPSSREYIRYIHIPFLFEPSLDIGII